MKILKKIILFLLAGIGLCFMAFVIRFLCLEMVEDNHHLKVKGKVEMVGEATIIAASKTPNYKRMITLTLSLEGKGNSPSLFYTGYVDNGNYDFLSMPAVWDILKKEPIGRVIPVKWVALEDGRLVFTAINNKTGVGAKNNFLIPIILAWGLTGFIFFLFWCLSIWRFLKKVVTYFS